MVHVGEETVVIGNPLGFEYSVTKGIVSAVRDDGNTKLVQIDAAVNPGNSGGPLINEFGSVVGIVSSKISLQGIEGLGFAIPIGEAVDKLDISIDFTEIEAKRTCGGITASN